MVPYLQSNCQAMVNLKMWFQNDLLKVTKARLLTVALFGFAFLHVMRNFFVYDYSTKLGMKDLLEDQQW